MGEEREGRRVWGRGGKVGERREGLGGERGRVGRREGEGREERVGKEEERLGE